MKNLLKFYIATTLLITTSGCISVRENKNPKIQAENFKISTTKKPNVFIDLNFHSSMFSQNKQSIIDKAKSDQKKMFSKIIEESDCCNVVDDQEKSNLVINGTFYNESSDTGIYFAYLTGFSFFVIPSWINSKMKISVQASNGKITKDYVFEDSVFIAQWLPLVLAMPFRTSPIKDESGANKDLYKSLLLKMKEDGLL